MSFSLNVLTGKRKFIIGLALLPFIFLLSAGFDLDDNQDFDFARREVLLRRIGHELLLLSGDDSSRVLPIKKISENEYQISFENELTFQPDSLVDIVHRWMGKDPISSDYVVKVLNCESDNVAYGYAISSNKKDDIVSCIGRKQPKSCYLINIKFKPNGRFSVKNGYVVGGLSFLAFVGFVFFRPVKPLKSVPDVQIEAIYVLGAIMFDAKNRTLLINRITTVLTGTETRLLLIFALSPNSIIERSQLQKEIWEDEGVIVGRSLDVFISKLRKKLELDPTIKIVVIRGKGYKLEVNV